MLKGFNETTQTALGEYFLISVMGQLRQEIIIVKLSNGAKQCGAWEHQTLHELFSKNV